MARNGYNNPVVFGGTLAAELVKKFIDLKAEARIMAALMKETTNDGNNCDQIEVGDTFGTVFSAKVGDGSALYQKIISISTALSTVTDETLADIYNG